MVTREAIPTWESHSFQIWLYCRWVSCLSRYIQISCLRCICNTDTILMKYTGSFINIYVHDDFNFSTSPDFAGAMTTILKRQGSTTDVV